MDAINKTLGNIYAQNTQTLTNLSNDKSPNELTEDEERKVEALKKRDAEVRAHEEAHKRAAGSLAKGAPNYKYEIGPDGKRYAIGGNVKIEMSEGNTPDETILKAQRIKKAALAPVHPSAQDRKIAAQASKMLVEAKEEKMDEAKENSEKIRNEQNKHMKTDSVNTKLQNKKLLNSYGDRLASDQSNYTIDTEI